jgi:hypothetical protein
MVYDSLPPPKVDKVIQQVQDTDADGQVHLNRPPHRKSYILLILCWQLAYNNRTNANPSLPGWKWQSIARFSDGQMTQLVFVGWRDPAAKVRENEVGTTIECSRITGGMKWKAAVEFRSKGLVPWRPATDQDLDSASGGADMTVSFGGGFGAVGKLIRRGGICVITAGTLNGNVDRDVLPGFDILGTSFNQGGAWLGRHPTRRWGDDRLASLTIGQSGSSWIVGGSVWFG